MSYGMHGCKRVDQTPEIQEALKKRELIKVTEYRKISDDYEAKRSKKEFDEEMLDITYRLLLLNPDYYSAWNDRRRALEATEASDFKSELELAKTALKLRPKTYWIWNHRLWTLSKMNQLEAWVGELQLTDYLLNLDPRNFHGWDYRRQVIRQLLSHGQPAEATLQTELAFTKTKIAQHFSNGSAWHYRSTLIATLGLNDLEKELELVRTAFYTDPDDQSAWIYYQWLISSSFVPSIAPPIIMPPQCHILSHGNSSNEILISIVLTFAEPITLIDFPIPIHPNQVLVHGWKIPSPNTANVSRSWKSSFKVSQAHVPFQLSFLLAPENIKCKGQLPTCVKFHKLFDETTLVTSSTRFVALEREVMKSADSSLSAQQRTSFLESEYKKLQELVDFEPNAKWPLLTQVFLKHEAQVASDCTSFFNEKPSERSKDSTSFYLESAKILSRNDPLRQGYYSSWS
ncbi:Rab geranylgeranyltransferase [Entomophthora muscae]|uniref:Rab geranylgeranyltransferase n=1 Tax=Entomophthora muscae TaxID=34485 RepID=A0ACC2SC99_9FUNG|nr:Rab geranylgeranyltransferase [Entomophthora muscae]